MRRSMLGILILLGMMLSFFLAATENPLTAQSLLGETPTIPPETPTPTVVPIPTETPTPTATPMPVGGYVVPVDRGAMLRANFVPLIVPLVALVMLIGIIGFVVIRSRPPA